MKTATRFALLFLLLSALGIPAAFAQGPGDVTLQRELERTDEILRKASELVASANNAQAAELLQSALSIQEQAHVAFRNGFPEVARIRTMTARGLANRIFSLLLDPEDRADRVEQELQHTDDMLARARDFLGPHSPDISRTLLEGALKHQSQAWELFRAGNHRPALRMTFQARELLNKLRLQTEEFDPARLEDEFRRTEELVARAMEAAQSGTSRVVQLAEQASELLRKAKEFVSDGRYLAARHHLTQAQRLAHRALRLQSGEPDVDDFERLSQQYQAGFERLSEGLRASHNEGAMQLAQESQEHFRLAHELYQAGPESEERAFAELNLALRLLNKAKDLLE